MKKCAFLTMDSLEDFESYDTMLVEPLAELGWQVDFISWKDSSADWDAFRAVIIRSPWDYHKDPERFMAVLEEIDHSSARLENSLELVRRNIHKTYLKDFETRGIEIVPTLWQESFERNLLPLLFQELNVSELVIKPVVSAGAEDTFRLNQASKPAVVKEIELTFANRSFMVQPFMQNIVDEGEFSLFFFGGTYSHTILKTPKTEDFRVQEEHGGRLKKVEPDPDLLVHAEEVMKTVDPLPLYARVDSIRTSNETFALMELELIEPSLYFNMDPRSPKRFARIFDQWMLEREGLHKKKQER